MTFVTLNSCKVMTAEFIGERGFGDTPTESVAPKVDLVSLAHELVNELLGEDKTDLIEFDKRQSGVSVEDELNEFEIQRETNEALEEDPKFAKAVDIDFDAVGAL